jgi:hypothetical protein
MALAPLTDRPGFIHNVQVPWARGYRIFYMRSGPFRHFSLHVGTHHNTYESPVVVGSKNFSH